MVTLTEALKVVVASFIASRALKIMGKKEFADIISLVGWLSVGLAIITMWFNFSDNISKIIDYIAKF